MWLSRFTVFEIPDYTYEEFETISVRIIKKLHQNAVIQIASSVWKAGSRDIRDVLKIAKLCNPADTEEDINRLIAIHQKYRKTGKDYNSYLPKKVELISLSPNRTSKVDRYISFLICNNCKFLQYPH